ncbi:hypothetical protein CDIK_4378, partial [Cucumispora dikerogammari]
REYKLLIEQFKNNNIYLVFDETTDIIGRQILNLLIGLCDETERKTAKLVKTISLEKTNSLNINIEILKLLDELFTTKDQYNNVRLIISDAAPYAIKVGKLLKAIIPEIKHVTCIIHELHRVVEFLRSKCCNIDRLVSFIKKTLTKNKGNIALFYEIF